MKPPLFVRPLTDAEREQLEAGLRSPRAFTLKRCQVLLASSRGHSPQQIGERFGYPAATIRHVLHAFNREGVQALSPESNRPKSGPSAGPVLDEPGRERVRQLLEKGPRAFGQEASFWTLSLLARVAFEQEVTAQLLDEDTLGAAVKRLGLSWKRVRKHIASPDPSYAHKKSGVIG